MVVPFVMYSWVKWKKHAQSNLFSSGWNQQARCVSIHRYLSSPLETALVLLVLRKQCRVSLIDPGSKWQMVFSCLINIHSWCNPATKVLRLFWAWATHNKHITFSTLCRRINLAGLISGYSASAESFCAQQTHGDAASCTYRLTTPPPHFPRSSLLRMKAARSVASAWWSMRARSRQRLC